MSRIREFVFALVTGTVIRLTDNEVYHIVGEGSFK